MIDLQGLCRIAGVDLEAAQRVFAAPSAHDEPVWYVQLVLGIGAWITAIAALGFIAIFLYEVLDIDEPGLGISFIGVALFAGSYWLLTSRHAGAFLSQLLIAGAICGASVAVLGIGVETESPVFALMASLPFLIASIVVGRSLLLQFLLAGLTITIVVLWSFDNWDAHAIDVLAFLMPAGVFLMLCPPRKDMRPTALAMILTLPASIVVREFIFGGGTILGRSGPPGWISWLVSSATLAALVGLEAHARWKVLGPRALSGAIVALAVVGAGALSPGLSSSLVLVALGYVTGRMALASLGSVGFAYFLFAFYHDIQQSLLFKSALLTLVGLLLLAVVFALSREDAKRTRP